MSEFERVFAARHGNRFLEAAKKGEVYWHSRYVDALAFWNAALAAVEAQIRTPAGNYPNNPFGDGWNRCLSVMSERIAALKEDAR